MKSLITKSICTLCIGMMSISAFCQDDSDSETKDRDFRIEIEPSSFILRGVAGSVSYNITKDNKEQSKKHTVRVITDRRWTTTSRHFTRWSDDGARIDAPVNRFLERNSHVNDFNWQIWEGMFPTHAHKKQHEESQIGDGGWGSYNVHTCGEICNCRRDHHVNSDTTWTVTRLYLGHN